MKEIQYEVNSLFLDNNEIREIKGLYETLTFVLPRSNPNNLMWLNLSYNHLTKIDEEILHFPQLKSLNLHKNYIFELDEVRKLGRLSNLRNLTLNSNPFEEIEGYRMYVLGMLYENCETLRKLDSVYVTDAEFDSAQVWNDHLYHKNTGKLKSLRPKLQKDEYGMVDKKKQKEWKPKAPPVKEEDENQKGSAAGAA